MPSQGPTALTAGGGAAPANTLCWKLRNAVTSATLLAARAEPQSVVRERPVRSSLPAGSSPTWTVWMQMESA